MNMTIALGLFFLFILIYLIIVDIFSILFRLTGLTTEDSKFQAISMLTNCGFTTKRSEMIMMSAMRRRLARITILFGYSFTVIIVSLFLNVFMMLNNLERTNLLRDGVGLAIAFVCCVMILRLRPVRKAFDGTISKLGMRIMYGKHTNVVLLVNTYGDKALCEIRAKRLPEFLKGTKLINSTLKEKYEILILLVRRNNETLDHITRHTILKEGDTIVAFGPYHYIQDIFEFPDKHKETA